MVFNGSTGNAVKDVKDFFEEVTKMESEMDYRTPSDMIQTTVELLAQKYPELKGVAEELEGK